MSGTESISRSYTGLPSLAGEAGGVPVYAFGRTFVYGVSPDFAAHTVIQNGNTRPQVKLQPKKSWEVKDNKLGSMVSWQPWMPRNDYQPLLSINLIDGDTETCWCNRGEGQADVAPAWVRIDLAAEENLQEIVLVPAKKWPDMPEELVIKISSDAWHWSTVYDGAPQSGEALHVGLATATPAKQIWINANRLPLISVGGVAQNFFVLSQVKAINEGGENLALTSRGASVTVSSTNYGYPSTWDVYDMLWPVQYDLGASWMRLSGSNPPYHNDTLLWRFVEQKKGEYVIDEKTDLAITEAARNGYKIIVILSYGNWLYTPEPEKETMDIHGFPPPPPPGPVTPEGMEGYKNWVRFMVEHFKGRVAYWEIYNEPLHFGFEVVEDWDERVKIYCDLVKQVVPVIRATDPNVKISLAGMGGVPALPNPFWEGRYAEWLHRCLDHGVAPLVDAIGWHIQGTVIPEMPSYKAYPQIVRAFQQEAEARGFKGIYMASEAWWGAPYPAHSQWPHPPHSTQPGLPRISEMQKAKDMARTFVQNVGLNVIPFWCNTWIDFPQNDCGLFRTTWAADPVSPTQPEPAYYVLRTLCSVLDGTEPAELDVAFSDTAHEFDAWTFSLPDNGMLVSVALFGISADKHAGVPTDATMRGVTCSKVIGIDTLSGIEQELSFEQKEDGVAISGLGIRDYPLMLKLVDVKRQG